jgi:hypothetical protein
MKKIAKAKSGKSFGMLSVKAGIDKNPKPTAADRIAGAKMNAGKAMYGKTMKADKAMYGTKVAGKKPMKKAQTGTTQSMELPEVEVTASRIKDKPSKAAKPQKNYTRDLIKRSNKMNKNQSGFSRMNPRKRFEDGGEVSMAKKGASVKKKAMGKCKMGC